MITVAVCTYNRAGKLRNVLDSLARMAVPAGVAWEIVVVDNNSTDDTAHVVERHAAAAPVAMRGVFEGRQGLAAARNRALSAARGDIVAFTDDDCRVAPDWLAVIAREFDRDRSLRLLGGRVELLNPGDNPMTTRTAPERRDLTGDPRALTMLIGCNFAFRRNEAPELGSFDTRFGVGSGLRLNAEDLDFMYRVWRRGERVRYAPELLVYHDHGRASHDQLEAQRDGYARGRGGFYAKHVLAGDRAVMRMAYWEARKLLRDALAKKGERRESLRALSSLLAGAAALCREHIVGRETQAK